MDSDKDIILKIIEDLTGQEVPLKRRIPDIAVELLTKPEVKGLGYSQLNELLLSLGYDRVSHSFFQFLVDRTTNYRTGSSIESLEDFRNGVDEFRKIAILFFGNIKFAFKNLSRDASFLREHLRRTQTRREKDFVGRHKQIMDFQEILADDTYLLGYIVKADLDKQLEKNPNDKKLLELEKRRQMTVEKGRKNHDGYLVSDHLDVYVATSMRERHEFISVNKVSRKIFSHDALINLKLRWFDPTQAYCEDRIDKGLAEGLMLRRAKCTIYFAQESDTFGKDSELASTLAQGKPVIAFVPRPSEKTAKKLIEQVAQNNDEIPNIILNQLRIYDPGAAWTDEKVRGWLEKPKAMVIDEGVSLLQTKIESHFVKRNNTLRDTHPLGVQINLQTGVANGVLVTNTVDECARVVRALLLRELKFKISSERKGDHEYIYLRENITNSIFRVVTGDSFLTNAFWNFYLSPHEDYSSANEDADYKKVRHDPYDLTRTAMRSQLSLFDVRHEETARKGE
jgi:hypothetical protein